MKRLILLAMAAAVCIVFCGGQAMAEEVINYSRITRSLNGLPENPALPLRTKAGTDGKVYGEYVGASGTTSWKDTSRQPYFVMPLKTDLSWYTSDGKTGAGTFTRASTAYYRNQYGTWTSVATNEPRFGFSNMSTADGWHMTKAGYLDEDASTNLALQSAAPANQTVSIGTTGYYTLWVEGTGSCAVAANSAVGTGFGTATSGTYVVFNITTIGTVDLTVTGSLDRFQLEKWHNPTSYIPTTTVAVTRAADVLTVPAAGIVDDAAGTVSVDYYSMRRNGVTAAGFIKWYQIVAFGPDWTIALQSATAKVQSNDGTGLGIQANFEWGQKTYTFACRWSAYASEHKLFNKTQGTTVTDTYDGSWDTSGLNIGIGAVNGANGYVSNLRIWKGVRLKDSEVAAL